MRPAVDLERFGACSRHAPARALACPSCVAGRLAGSPHRAGRLRLVEAARALVGAPFSYRGRAGRGGVDCSGLVVCSARAVGVPAPDFTVYPDTFVGDGFRAAWAAFCDPIALDDVLPGDVLLCRTRRQVGHSHLVTERGTTIHAARRRGVVEEPIDGAFVRRVDSAVRIREFRELEAARG